MTYPDDMGATAPATAVERRLYQYAGCNSRVYRWFIVGDRTPMPYLTEAEALAELRRRRDDRKRGAA